MMLIVFSSAVGIMLFYLPVLPLLWLPVNQGIWIMIFRGCSSMADAVISDTVPMYVNPRELGSAHGLIGVSESIAAIAGSIIAGQFYNERAPTHMPGAGIAPAFNFLATCAILAAISGIATKFLAGGVAREIAKKNRIEEENLIGPLDESARL